MVHDDLKLTVSGSLKPNGSLQAEFSQDFVAASASANFCNGNTNLKASIAFGADGLSVGGATASTVSKDGSFSLNDYNFGINYAEKDFNAALVTKNNGNVEVLFGVVDTEVVV